MDLKKHILGIFLELRIFAFSVIYYHTNSLKNYFRWIVRKIRHLFCFCLNAVALKAVFYVLNSRKIYAIIIVTVHLGTYL